MRSHLKHPVTILFSLLWLVLAVGIGVAGTPTDAAADPCINRVCR